MPPISYHAAQIELQSEANSGPIADHLANWIEPVARFGQLADLLILATVEHPPILRFTVVSGRAPSLQVEMADTISVRLPESVFEHIPASTRCGGLFINLA